MPDRVFCHVEELVVRSDSRETLEDLIFTLFQRRHHHFVGGSEKDWLTVELVQSLRQKSEVYREELSSEMAGPLPFALGYFQLKGDRLFLTTENIPGNMAPEPFMRFLSEFVEPGGRVWFGQGKDAEGWEIRGQNDLQALGSESAPSVV